MKVAFRCDASKSLGTGHVYRCLTLADALRPLVDKVSFTLLRHSDNLAYLIKSRGYDCIELDSDSLTPELLGETKWRGYPQMTDYLACSRAWQANQWHPDLIIVDHYSLSKDWEQEAKKLGSKVCVIDDLANRPHDCDVLLDQTLGRQANAYSPLIMDNTRLCLGGEYSLLRSEFAQFRAESLANKQNKRRIDSLLIAMGGADSDNVSLTILNAVSYLQNIKISLLTGPLYAHQPSLEDFKLANPNIPLTCYQSIDNVAEVLAQHDIAIGASGASSWERMALGLPTLVYCLAPNQALIAKQVETFGAGRDMGNINHFCTEQLQLVLNQIINNNTLYQDLVVHSAKAINPYGAEKMAQALIEVCGN